MLTHEETASAVRLADFLSETKYDRELMQELFKELRQRTPEHIQDVLNFWKTTDDTTRRLFLEVCTYLQAPNKEAITFRV